MEIQLPRDIGAHVELGLGTDFPGGRVDSHRIQLGALVTQSEFTGPLSDNSARSVVGLHAMIQVQLNLVCSCHHKLSDDFTLPQIFLFELL